MIATLTKVTTGTTVLKSSKQDTQIAYTNLVIWHGRNLERLEVGLRHRQALYPNLSREDIIYRFYVELQGMRA